MSSESDKVVFEESVEGQDNVNLFEAKKWTYITDSSSSNGVFSGQIQFDLNTLSSQNQWTSLSDAIIQFPVKLTLTNTNALAPTLTDINAACIKNGFHQFVDSVQIVIGGTTVQSSQIFTNIDTNYKILTEWSKDTLTKYGPTLGVALDDIVGTADTAVVATDSVDNMPLCTTALNGLEGFTTWNTGSGGVTFKNPGIKERLIYNNNNTTATVMGKSILGINQSVLGKSNVQVNASAAAADIYCLYALGTIKLSQLSDAISKMPLVKGLKGFIYLNYNSTETTITNTGASSTITGISTTAKFGRCCPGMLNISGLTLNNTATAPVVFKADINGTTSGGCPLALPTQSNAILYAPYYVATPEVDRALTFKKTIRYNERFVTQFSLTDGGQANQTLTPGISNPKRVILYPYFTGPGSSGNSGFITNPLLSPFDSVPSTTSPFASLANLQLYCANMPIFQTPINMDWQTFANEVAQNGLDGGSVDQASSGLLSQRTWNQLYKYYTVDLSRRQNGSDGASKSIQISCSNPTKCPMNVIAIIWYEREITVDTASGMVMQSM